MHFSRREFIKYSGSLAAGLSVTPLIGNPLTAAFSPNEKVVVALIGCRNMGWHNLKNHLKIPGVECAALCDVDENVLTEKAAQLKAATGKMPKLYKDYRNIIDDKSIDAIIVGTPDHWHCLPTVHACEVGKDVYVEKPVANSIAECEMMLQAARKYNRVVQVGQQQRSGQHWQDAITYVKAGKLGKIRTIKTWANFNYGKTKPEVPDSPVPAGVDYNMWLGPAPERPFNVNRFHSNWRFSWDYGGGLMTDWGVHLLDIPLWIMDGRMPKSVTSAGGIYAYPDHAIETADTQSVLYDYHDLTIEWGHAGGLNKGIYGRNYGVAFIGNNGTLVINREGWEVIPEMDENTNNPKLEALPLQAPDRQDHEKHVANFIACVKNRNRPICDIEDGRNAAVLAHMGNIAYRTNDRLLWDTSRNNFRNNAEANALIKPDYRRPWKFPKV